MLLYNWKSIYLYSMKADHKYFEKLHEKFIAGTIITKGKIILYSQYEDLFTLPDGSIAYSKLDEFLTVSHKSYGKPVNGIVSVI